MKIHFILNDPPFGTERCFDAFYLENRVPKTSGLTKRRET